MQVKVEANLKKLKEDIETNQEKADTNHKVMAAETKAMRDNRMEANRNAWRKERMTCQEMTEARLECEEPTSADGRLLGSDGGRYREDSIRSKCCRSED
jgi:hypothetical protein